MQAEGGSEAAHDAYTRLLTRLEPDSEGLWQEAEPQVQKRTGVLILDDTTLDKPYAQKMELVTYHWSGKHRRAVKGINLLTLLWSDGERQIPCDYRLYAKADDGLTKNDHFQALVQQAQARGFAPECVLFDSWYSGLENLKCVRDLGWRWLTRLKANRLVNPDGTGLRPLSTVALAPTGTLVHLKGYGSVRLFPIVATDGDREVWATNDLHMDELTRLRLTENSWAIEAYHRGLKQCCGVERAQVRRARPHRNHIGLALRAFLRLEHACFLSGRSWVEAKFDIIRPAVRAYLAHPLFTFLPPTA